MLSRCHWYSRRMCSKRLLAAVKGMLDSGHVCRGGERLNLRLALLSFEQLDAAAVVNFSARSFGCILIVMVVSHFS